MPAGAGTAAEASSGGGYAVAVASERSAADADAVFRSLQAKFPNQLGGREPIVRRTDLGPEGIYYRASIGPFVSMKAAARVCSSLRAAGEAVSSRKIERCAPFWPAWAALAAVWAAAPSSLPGGPQLRVIIAMGTAMTVAAKPDLSAASKKQLHRFLGSAIAFPCRASPWGSAATVAWVRPRPRGEATRPGTRCAGRGARKGPVLGSLPS